MGKTRNCRQVLATNVKAERKAARAKLGKLPELLLRRSTRSKYEAVFEACFSYQLQQNRGLGRTSNPAFDEEVCAYLAMLWEDGETRGLAGDTLSALQHFLPALKGHLKMGWRFLTTWQTHEMPARTPPFLKDWVESMAGFALADGHLEFSACLLWGFDCYPRPGEVTGRLVADFSLHAATSSYVVQLGWTKGGQRKGAKESVAGDDPLAFLLLAAALQNKKPFTPLLAGGNAQYRALFKHYVAKLGLDVGVWQPYGLRRGGATHDFSERGSLDELCVKGRWSNQRTARIYLNQGLAMLSKIQLQNAQLRCIGQGRKLLRALIGA